MIRYLVFLIASLLVEVVARIIAPVLPAFATMQPGKTDNNNSFATEPRLPRWLAWFQTPDNSLWGDTGWRTIHYPNYDSYWGMVRWLWRNSATGFARSVLARGVFLRDVKYTGNPKVTAERPGIFDTFRATDGSTWQFKKAFPLWGKNIGFNFGWQINSMIESGQDYDLCHYKFSVKIK